MYDRFWAKREPDRKVWKMERGKLKKLVQEIMDKAVAENYTAGVNLLVYRDGEELLYAQSGFADLEEGRPIERDTLFRLYSMTKPITSAAVMILMERGMIDLGDLVEQFLPGFLNQKVAEGGELVPVHRRCTVRDLLSMTSGLLYGWPSIAGKEAERVFEERKAKLYSDDALSTVEIANRFGSNPLQFHPGEHFNYGTSADILGAMVELVSGMRFGDFLRKEIFEPLSMHDTGFYIPRGEIGRLAKTYVSEPDGSIHEEQTIHLGIHYRPVSAPAFESGGAGLISSLPDYMRFAQMLHNGGSLDGKQILKPETVRYMTQGALLPWQQGDFERSWDGLTGYSYGNLMRVMKDPGRAIMLTTPGEYGWDGWLGPYFSNHPGEKITILIGMQKKDAGTCSLTRRLRNVILSNIL